MQCNLQWFLFEKNPPNGERYPRVGGTRERRFDGISLEPRELLENAATPTRRVHAVLGALILVPFLLWRYFRGFLHCYFASVVVKKVNFLAVFKYAFRTMKAVKRAGLLVFIPQIALFEHGWSSEGVFG